MKTAVNVIIGIITTAVAILTLLATVSAYAPASAFFSALSVFVVFFPILIAMDVLLFLHWLFNGKFLMSLAIAAVLILSLPQLLHIVSLSPELESRENDGGIKILSCNVKFFGFSEEECDTTLAYLNASGADILCLQEFGYYTGKQPSLGRIKSKLKQYPYMHISKGSGTPKGIQKHIVTFSKFRMAGKKEIDLMSPYHRAIVSDIIVNEDTLHVFNCYLESNKLTQDEKQFYDDASLQNIFKKLSDASVKRNAQAEIISRTIGQSPEHTIICGDFNDVPNSKTYNLLRGNTNDAFLSLRRGLGITFHEGIYNFRIDYIFASQDVELLNFSLDKQDISDHYPIMATVLVDSE